MTSNPTTYVTLRPFRDYNEKDVINLFAYSGALIDTTYQILATKGTFVRVTGQGALLSNEPIQMIGGFGNFQVNNFVAQRYGTTYQVAAAQATDQPLGMLLFDCRELDENLLPLKYNPRKAAEMEAAISGQSIPIVTKGMFLYSGVQILGGVAAQAGNPVYISASGFPATSGSIKIGKFLSSTGADGATALLYINCQNS